MLETESLTIRFGGHVAVDGVTCAFQPGTLTAIVGPNGAGKTTYFNLISGQLPATVGHGPAERRGHHALCRAAPHARWASAARSSSPISFPTSARSRTCGSPCRSKSGKALDLLSRTSTHRELIDARASISRACRWRTAPHAVAATLPHGDQRKLEVAILLALEPDIFMFDEPTAGMSVDEVPVVLDLIAAIKERGDKTILLVEHKMDVVRSLADRIIVLHNGKLVADGKPAEVIASPIVQEAYLGDRASEGASRSRMSALLLDASARRARPISAAITSCMASSSTCPRAG